MIVSPAKRALPELAKAIRDRHHILNVFDERKLLRPMREDRHAGHAGDQDF